MCKRRKIEFAYLGMRVEIIGKVGTIVGNWKTNLYVVFDGDSNKYNVHPHWEIAYFDENGRVVKEYQKGVYAI
ncbi:hypothetical protein [Bacillus sp. CGMCC 1.60114]|uniref:hypothetical protein n=1 Tax=unclassified Bacillus (in: firmicutes) TaxID=185979 RepID=UPI00366AACCA